MMLTSRILSNNEKVLYQNRILNFLKNKICQKLNKMIIKPTNSSRSHLGKLPRNFSIFFVLKASIKDPLGSPRKSHFNFPIFNLPPCVIIKEKAIYSPMRIEQPFHTFSHVPALHQSCFLHFSSCCLITVSNLFSSIYED